MDERHDTDVEKADLENQNEYRRHPLLPVQRVKHDVAKVQSKRDFEERNQSAQRPVLADGTHRCAELATGFRRADEFTFVIQKRFEYGARIIQR